LVQLGSAATLTLPATGSVTINLPNGPIIVTDGGEPVAAVVAIENADLESLSLSTNPEFVEIIERSRARGKREGRISADEMERRFRHPARPGDG